MPTQTFLTIHLIRSAPPFEFDVYSSSEIDSIPELPGVFCLAKPRPESSPLIADDWLFCAVDDVNDLKKAIKEVTSQDDYDPDFKILVRTFNPQNLREHGHISFSLIKSLGWLGKR